MEKLTDRELCANITIRKGATDRRSVPYKSITKNNCFGWTRGGYFFVFLSLPNAYPALKQAKPKLSTLSKSEILIGIPSFVFDP